MRIYLAGPDVFLPNAGEIAAAKKDICARHGAVGVFPTDPVADHAADAADERYLEIYLRNEAHIRQSDALIANLTPFRGPSADAGTVYELGFMRALGRPISGYANTTKHFAERTRNFLGDAARQGADGVWVDAEGLSLEDFGRHDNLMIDGGIVAAGGLLITREVPDHLRWTDLAAFEACVAAMVQRMRGAA
ncbi:MAG TPA: nucleoside 2-deoxyribosyltransferase [Roseomonas sp.]|nr:nucleoside 2-deoxyribosyltransferase [Roseomonas sp.]